MSSKNSGYLYLTNRGEYFVAYNKAQTKDLFKLGRLIGHFFQDSLMQKPVIQDGAQKVGLKHLSTLTHIGYVD